MRTDTQPIATRIFYRTDPAPAFRQLPGRLTEAFAHSNIGLTQRQADGGDLVFDVGGLTLTVSHSAHALDTAGTDRANRPEAATLPMHKALGRLARHAAAVTIRVTGPQAAARPETRLAICYIATMQMQRLADPDLIHWLKSDTLYTIEEFRSSTGAHRPIRPRPAATILPAGPRARTNERPKLPTAWKGRALTPEFVARGGDMGRATDLRHSVFAAAPVPGARAAGPAARLAGAASHRALASLVAPLSAGLVLASLLPGGLRLG